MMPAQITNTIPMVDLKNQHIKIKQEINDAIGEVIESATFINGPAVKSFARSLEEYLDVKHVIPCGNGTDALQVALMALGLNPGDEVITPTFTYIATAEVVELLKLKLVLVDVDADSFTVDIDQIRKAITHRTKAIIPVHLYGQCVNMNDLLQLANEHNLFIVEDTAQALGASYRLNTGQTKKAGTMGDIGCTSFFPSKNLGCLGDGGALFTNDDRLAQKISMICNHGQSEKYKFDMVGINSRLDSIQAAVLNVKLKYLDTYIKSRQWAAEFYDKAFKGHANYAIPCRKENSTHCFHQYTLKTKNISRDNLSLYLKKMGIPTVVYYPIPIHLNKGYSHLGYAKGSFPVTEEICDTAISLPMHTELDEEQLLYIAETVLSYKE